MCLWCARLIFNMDVQNPMAWDIEEVVRFIEHFCETTAYTKSIRMGKVNGKSLVFMTLEGWLELGITSIAHRHMLIGWSKALVLGRESSNTTREPSHSNLSSLPSVHGSICLSTNAISTLPLPSHVDQNSIPVTYERIFRPKEVYHLYPLVGKKFLQKYYVVQHKSYCKSMDTIRKWFKDGFNNMGIQDFSRLNFRRDIKKKKVLINFIKSMMHTLKPLYFGNDNIINWQVEDVYIKVIRWRHYKRHQKISNDNDHLSLPSINNGNEVSLDVMRKRCYPLQNSNSTPTTHMVRYALIFILC